VFLFNAPAAMKVASPLHGNFLLVVPSPPSPDQRWYPRVARQHVAPTYPMVASSSPAAMTGSRAQAAAAMVVAASCCTASTTGLRKQTKQVRSSRRLLSRRAASERPSTQEKGVKEKTEERLREVEERLKQLEGLMDESEDQPMTDLRTESPELEYDVQSPIGSRYGDVRRELPRALPFLPEPAYREFAANVPGDAGFDPLGLCTDVTTFANYREAETKHGRLAMLAAIAWPLAELGDRELAEEGKIDILADTGGRALPQLTGGLEDQFVELFLAILLVVGSFFELNFTKPKDGPPGDYGVDPLQLRKYQVPEWMSGLLPKRRPWTAEAEIKHGRLAMFAVLYDFVDELVTGNPVVEDTEFFFHRIDARLLSAEYWGLQPDFIEEFPTNLEVIG